MQQAIPVCVVSKHHTQRNGLRACRISMGEAAVKAAVPGANITDVIATLESKIRMVLVAFNNTDLYRKLYWSGIGYEPATRAARRARLSSFLKREQTPGESRHTLRSAPDHDMSWHTLRSAPDHDVAWHFAAR
jgi:hypothetical protein